MLCTVHSDFSIHSDQSVRQSGFKGNGWSPPAGLDMIWLLLHTHRINRSRYSSPEIDTGKRLNHRLALKLKGKLYWFVSCFFSRWWTSRGHAMSSQFLSFSPRYDLQNTDVDGGMYVCVSVSGWWGSVSGCGGWEIELLVVSLLLSKWSEWINYYVHCAIYS